MPRSSATCPTCVEPLVVAFIPRLGRFLRVSVCPAGHSAGPLTGGLPLIRSRLPLPV